MRFTCITGIIISLLSIGIQAVGLSPEEHEKTMKATSYSTNPHVISLVSQVKADVAKLHDNPSLGIPVLRDGVELHGEAKIREIQNRLAEYEHILFALQLEGVLAHTFPNQVPQGTKSEIVFGDAEPFKEAIKYFVPILEKSQANPKNDLSKSAPL